MFGAYWGPRIESVDDCAIRIVDLIDGLGQISPAFADWYRVGMTASIDGTAPVRLHEEVSKLTETGESRRDTDGLSMPDLGYTVGLWNGRDDLPVGLSITCGLYATEPDLMNSIVIDLPDREGGTEAGLYEREAAIAMTELVAEVWRPDWAVFVTRSSRRGQEARPREPVVGFVTYLSELRGRPEISTPRVSTRALPDGSLIVFDGSIDQLNKERVGELYNELHAGRFMAPTP